MSVKLHSTSRNQVTRAVTDSWFIPPLSLRDGVTAMAEEDTRVPRKPLPGAFAATVKRLTSWLQLLLEINFKLATVRAQHRDHV